jgi:RNA polymerase sigma-70 factor (ECF subfamily)
LAADPARADAAPDKGFRGGPLPAAPAPEEELETLLLRVGRGDRGAFAALYDRSAAKLFGLAVRILGQKERAEDVLQESFVAVWNRAADYAPERGAAMTWLATIVRHRAIDNLRRRSRQPEQLAESEAALLNLAASPGDAADRGAGLVALQRCLEELGPEQRRAVLLGYAYGFTNEELAQRLAAPLGTVKSWLRRSLERLKECLDG